jgi:hypothetical protein
LRASPGLSVAEAKALRRFVVDQLFRQIATVWHLKRIEVVLDLLVHAEKVVKQTLSCLICSRKGSAEDPPHYGRKVAQATNMWASTRGWLACNDFVRFHPNAIRTRCLTLCKRTEI